MNPRFSEVTKNLDFLYKQLLAMPSVTASSLPKTMPKKGIYLFSENGKYLYVGRRKQPPPPLAPRPNPKDLGEDGWGCGMG